MTLKYPTDLNEINVDYVTFAHFEYRSNANRETQGQAPSRGQQIVLYVPNTTPTVGTDNDWGQMNFEGHLGSLLRDVAMSSVSVANDLDVGAILQSPEGARGQADMVVNRFKERFSGDLKERAGGATRQAIIGAVGTLAGVQSPSQVLALSKGQSYNPNVELLYKSPKLRPFSMSYTFVPKSREENQRVNEIIKEFKKWSSPRDLQNGMFQVPDLWQVTYKTGGTDNIQMNKFKPAALTNVSVVDNPTANMHVSHRGGAPVERIMTLSFMEVELVLQNDYDNEEGIGF